MSCLRFLNNFQIIVFANQSLPCEIVFSLKSEILSAYPQMPCRKNRISVNRYTFHPYHRIDPLSIRNFSPHFFHVVLYTWLGSINRDRFLYDAPWYPPSGACVLSLSSFYLPSFDTPRRVSTLMFLNNFPYLCPFFLWRRTCRSGRQTLPGVPPPSLLIHHYKLYRFLVRS